jgi:D-xylose 1-dehydrogenase (NADP+, D-xylono-1,5-lactone-forming)
MNKNTKGLHQKLNWGILGAARVNERLLPAIVESKNSQLVAIASRRPNAASDMLKKYAPSVQNVTCYDNLDALLKDSNVHAIYIPLSNREHTEWALRAIECGKHVLIEKPMSLTVADICAIEETANKYKVKAMEGFMYRFHPQHDRIKEIIDSGSIGEVHSTHASFSFMMRQSRMYRIEEDITKGGGAMWDIGPYAIHTSRLWFKEQPKSVTAVAKYVASGADISTSGIIDFGEGKHAHFDVSFERSRQSEYTVIGTKGGIKCHFTWQLPEDVPVITWWAEDGKTTEELLPSANHYNLEIEHFSDCVLSDRAPLLTFSDAKTNCSLINATLHSAKQGVVVHLDR